MENKTDKNEKQNNKSTRKSGTHLQRYMWALVYTLIGALMLVGVYLIVVQYVYIGEEPFEAPPPLTPIPSLEQTPITQTETPEGYSPTPEITPEPTPEPEPVVPVQITFTRQKVQCEVQTVGRNSDNEIGTIDSATIAAWFDESATPNLQGNCIINGHVTWKGKKGTFSYLMGMEEGDEVVVKLEDDTYRYYEVLYIEEHPYNDFPKYHLETSGRDRLTLITCKGDYSQAAGTSLTRVIVVCMPKAENQ